MATPDESAAFRRLATAAFRLFVAGLFAAALGIVALGWWLFGWWGAAGGGVLAALLVAVGLAGGGMIYAMSQDSG